MSELENELARALVGLLAAVIVLAKGTGVTGFNDPTAIDPT